MEREQTAAVGAPRWHDDEIARDERRGSESPVGHSGTEFAHQIVAPALASAGEVQRQEMSVRSCCEHVPHVDRRRGNGAVVGPVVSLERGRDTNRPPIAAGRGVAGDDVVRAVPQFHRDGRIARRRDFGVSARGAQAPVFPERGNRRRRGGLAIREGPHSPGHDAGGGVVVCAATAASTPAARARASVHDAHVCRIGVR